MAYRLPGLAVAPGEAASSRCKVFGKASTPMSDESCWLGSVCWRGLARALESTRAKRKLRETEVMTESLAWERAEKWFAFEERRGYNDNMRHLEDRNALPSAMRLIPPF